ncbi:sigma-54-dependent Fis family transcriptional regulator [Aliikangiella marina]|uniref:Sigma-54-dependent Fis family transcriptional regulator n=1 Tax=Aliikangiella marina TaxID=1712262 RepID=A0A545T4Y9_9GAMM|nr:sigma-54 dependent transcriptional regulator [Aliikangiella marina]TQV72310.1 sigma-54-dependent Fis family transcriptional regulator [Aliikangiella marina]
MNHTILIVDDDVGILSALQMLLKTQGFKVVSAESPKEALAAFSRQSFDLIVMDLNYSMDTTSGDEGIQLIEKIRQSDDLVPIVVMTGWGTIELAVNTMQKGANDFIQKPWKNERLLAIINNQLKLATSQKQSQKLSAHNQILQAEIDTAEDLIAQSSAMQRVMQIVNQVAQSDINVLLTGENGTGKSLLARYIHRISKRKEAPQVSVNMGAVAESLFESEMFGHVKGAFTDAKSTRIGRFELADSGTLFLDEIANTPVSQQGKLLRVLEERQFEKVGASRTQTVDVRIISATNANLNEAVELGLFRKDLLYRLNTIEIEIPPLRERKADILPLAQRFLAQVAAKYGQSPATIDEAATQALLDYNWPGNVRELSHVLERAHILSIDDLIGVKALGLVELPAGSSEPDDEEVDLRPLEMLESEIIRTRLEYFEGNAVEAAKSLGLSRSAFYRRLEK